MLWVPQKGLLRCEHNTGAVGTASPGTAVTTGASSAVKGAVVQLIASTAFDVYWITVIAQQYGLTATASDGCLDILIGETTEEVLIPDLLIGGCGGDVVNPIGFKQWQFPIYIPKGSRLSARGAGLRVSTALRVLVFLYGGIGIPPFRVGTKVTTYGITTVPDGTTVVPGASGAEGAWTQISAASSENHFAFVPSFQVTNDPTTGGLTQQVDIGIGAATEEQIGEYWFITTVAEGVEGPLNGFPTFADVPSGTRLVMRASNSGANDAGYNCAIHAVS